MHRAATMEEALLRPMNNNFVKAYWQKLKNLFHCGPEGNAKVPTQNQSGEGTP